jgi:RNA polymerase sigma-70 factor, ECF subfamily
VPRGPFGYPNRIEQVIVNAAFTEARILPSHFSSQFLPQNPGGRRSWYVNARSMAEPSEIGISNSEGLDAIFRAHYERLARVIGRVIHDQARAEELAVEVFLKWWRNPQAHGEHAEGWLYRTAVREALDELRRQTRRSRFERLFRFVRESPQTPEHLYAVNAEQHRVRTVLGALNRRHAGMLLLWSQGFSYQEIAISLAVNSNYVGSLVSRAQEAFRKEYLKRYGNQS